MNSPLAMRHALDHLPIETFIPHRGAMCLVDRLLEADGDGAVVEADLRRSGWPVRDGAVPPWFGIEYMAQSVAAWSGYRAWLNGRPPRVGMLLGSRCYKVASRIAASGFRQGTPLRIEVLRVMTDANGLGLFDCLIFAGQKALASARLTVVEPFGPLPA